MSDSEYDHLMDNSPSFLDRVGMADDAQKPMVLVGTIGAAVAVAASLVLLTRKGRFLGDSPTGETTTMADANIKRIAARRKRNGFYQTDGAVYWRGNYNGAIRDWMIIRPDGKPANQKAIVQKLIKTYHEKNQ
jgi:hypothetical protein